MTSFSTELFVFYKGFCCLDGVVLGLSGGFLVDRWQMGLVGGQTSVDEGRSAVSSGQCGVDGRQRALFGQEISLDRSQMSLERAHNRLDRRQSLQVLDIFRPKGGAQSAVECGDLSQPLLKRLVALSSVREPLAVATVLCVTSPARHGWDKSQQSTALRAS